MNRSIVTRILVNAGYIVSEFELDVVVKLPHRLVSIEEIAALLPMAADGEIYKMRSYEVAIIC